MPLSLVRLVPWLAAASSLCLVSSLRAAPTAQDAQMVGESAIHELVARGKPPPSIQDLPTPNSGASQRKKGNEGRHVLKLVDAENFDTTPDNHDQKKEFQKEAAQWGGKKYANTLVYEATGGIKDLNYVPVGVAWQEFNAGHYDKKKCEGKFIQVNGKNMDACTALKQREALFAARQKNKRRPKDGRPGAKPDAKPDGRKPKDKKGKGDDGQLHASSIPNASVDTTSSSSSKDSAGKKPK